jgi:hypothetical protein
LLTACRHSPTFAYVAVKHRSLLHHYHAFLGGQAQQMYHPWCDAMQGRDISAYGMVVFAETPFSSLEMDMETREVESGREEIPRITELDSWNTLWIAIILAPNISQRTW